MKKMGGVKPISPGLLTGYLSDHHTQAFTLLWRSGPFKAQGHELTVALPIDRIWTVSKQNESVIPYYP